MPKTQLRLRRLFVRLFAIVGAAVIAAACSTDPAVKKQQYLESGNQRFEKKEYRAAIIEYRNAVAIDAKFGPARAKMAEAYALIGDLPNALREYVRAADLLPQDFDLQLRAGAFLLAAGQADQALVRAERALKLKPTNVDALILRGNALAGLNSIDKALESIEQAIRLEPKRGDTFTQKGILELARGQQDDAEAAFKQAIELAPNSSSAHLAIANFYWAVGRREETEAALRAALNVEPKGDATNRAMAVFLLATNRSGEAEPYLRTIADTSKQPEAIFALADYYLMSGAHKEAIARLQPLADKGNVPGSRQRLARAYAISGDRAKASALVEQILSKTPRDTDAQLLKGQLLLDEGKRDAALAIMRTAAQSDPASVEAHYAVGKMYAARGDNAAAIEEFQEVVKLNPRATAAQIELARLELVGGDATKSVQRAEEATRSAPNNASARLTLIRSLLAAKDIERAEREINGVREALANEPQFVAQLGMLAFLKNDFAGARAAFEQAAKLDPESLEAAAGLIALDLNSKNYQSAKARADARINTEKPKAEALLLAARTYASANDLAASERFLRRAIEVDPTILPAYAMLAQIYLNQKRLDEAREEFDRLATRQTKPIAALTMSGMILQQQGKNDLAKKRYESVLALDSRAALAANNLAWMYAESGENLDAAQQLAQTATSVAPDVPEMMDTLGWVYYKKKLAQLAIPQFARCVEKDPKNALYHYHLGLAYIQAGDSARARASLQRGLASNPDPTTDADIRRALSESGSPVATR